MGDDGRLGRSPNATDRRSRSSSSGTVSGECVDGSGIGAEMVQQFARQGARVAFLDRDVEASQSVVRALAGSVPHAPRFLLCDLTDVSALRSALAGIASELGAITVLVNNAASDDRHTSAEITPEYWDERLAVNLRHQFFAIQAAYIAVSLRRRQFGDEEPKLYHRRRLGLNATIEPNPLPGRSTRALNSTANVRRTIAAESARDRREAGRLPCSTASCTVAYGRENSYFVDDVCRGDQRNTKTQR
jgi:NAD(P)-dependent dehydrogenase (short-subunit alcohol dehydrogenase family)